ncbi:15790_t:CDS:2 [Entrophospora sp. SA101]|nr:15790_t:CDS:2 [Entrophospora sp. SA101]
MTLIVNNLKEFGSNLEKYLLQLKLQKRFRLSQIVILLIIITLEFIEYKSFGAWTKTYTTLESTKFFSNDKTIAKFFGYKSYDAFVIIFTSIVLVKSLLCLDV